MQGIWQRTYFILLATLWLLWAGCTHAGTRPADLAMLLDEDGSETISSVMRPEVAARFVAVPGDLNAGVSRAVYWLRFSVPATSTEQWIEVQPPFVDDIRLFEPTAAGMIEHRAGDRLPFSAREVSYRAFVFRLAVQPGQPRVMYLRVVNDGPAIAFVRLWEPAEFHAAASLESGLFGVHFGMFAAVLFFNLVNWIWLRNALYGWFCLHVAVGTLLNLGFSGYLNMGLLASAPSVADMGTRMIGYLAVSASAPFYRQLLRIERGSFAYGVYLVGMFLPLLMILPMLLGYHVETLRILLLLMLVAIATSLMQGVRLARKGGLDATLVTAGISVTLFGLGASTMTYMGVVPGDLWLMHGRTLTGIGYVLAMHVAVVTRLRDAQDASKVEMARADAAEALTVRERQIQREQAQFIAMLSHELKNPLAVIDGAAQSLARLPGAAEPEVRQRHERIRRSVAAINGLVEKFLDQDRIEDPRLFVRHEMLDISALLQAIVDEEVSGHERLQLSAPAVLVVRGDPSLLRVAVNNLIDNALKYAPQATLVEVTLSAVESDDAGVTITVADRGPGISDPDFLSLKYVRGNHSGNVSGAGLGLYLVRRIALLHEGYLTFAARTGGGTVATLRLPAGAVPAESA